MGSIKSLRSKFTHRANWEQRKSTDKFRDVSNGDDFVLKTFSGMYSLRKSTLFFRYLTRGLGSVEVSKCFVRYRAHTGRPVR